MIAIARGMPAIAVSAHQSSKHDHRQAPKIAALVVDIVAKLEASRAKGEAILPLHTGINVNLPEHLDQHKGFKSTRVGWSMGPYYLQYYEDLSTSDLIVSRAASGILRSGEVKDKQQALQIAKKKYAGISGFGATAGNLGDQDPDSEANAVSLGYITISAIDGNIQGSEQSVSIVKTRLSALFTSPAED